MKLTRISLEKPSNKLNLTCTYLTNTVYLPMKFVVKDTDFVIFV